MNDIELLKTRDSLEAQRSRLDEEAGKIEADHAALEERVLAHNGRTQALNKSISEFMEATVDYPKTVHMRGLRKREERQ